MKGLVEATREVVKAEVEYFEKLDTQQHWEILVEQAYQSLYDLLKEDRED